MTAPPVEQRADTDRCHTWHSRRYLRRNRPDQPDQMPAACGCCDETEEHR